MAEAEDVITDVARHATVFARSLWRRHAASPRKGGPPPLPRLEDFARRIDLLIGAVFGTSYPIRTAQAPAPRNLLAKVFRNRDGPRPTQPLPATDGVSIWLPAACPGEDPAGSLERFRTCALQQAMRAHRGSASCRNELSSGWLSDVYLLVEAHAADEALALALPGTAASINRLRRDALRRRPDLHLFPLHRRPLEKLVRGLLQADCGQAPPQFPRCESPQDSLAAATRLLLLPSLSHDGKQGGSGSLLFRDWWTGDLREPVNAPAGSYRAAEPAADERDLRPRTARLSRSPRVRKVDADEDDARQGAFMIQTAQPHEHAEDAGGMQRPTDRDEQSPADDFAESLSDLPEARLVSTPGRSTEVLLSDDAPGTRTFIEDRDASPADLSLTYPEWDFRIGSYHRSGATVRLMQSVPGPQQWVDETVARHRGLRDTIRRRFEMLRAQPVRLRRQFDGDEIDLQAYVDGYADYRAGLPMSQALYQTARRARRNMAIMLLIDVSGSTDGWIAGNRRVIDVEREALLLVCTALDAMAEPYSILAFSGEGPHRVSVRSVKRFDEVSGNLIARRIAGLEPDLYTRAGAAIRHATTLLMEQAANHRLLLLLSDGKPNDIDLYAGRYGLEDTRQAVTEARLQGIWPFCLTVDRQASRYLPAVFGAHQYALLPRPELLPSVLLDWMRRLVTSGP